MANLVELFDNIVQMQNLNGVPLAAGKLYVYALGRTRLMDSWSDVDGESLNPNPIILDDAGQAHVYVSDDFDYTLVVCDQYNNEIFSLDKYLYSKGSHSHADVAVAPSESIAVSSYHVGECTVYVPYLTGQLGKVYEGIDPIVVNNQVDKISANHVPLGVQDPLYFVQDDEEGCIIGCSAQTEIPSALSSKWDEASDVVIANSAQWAEGTEYEAGNYISIDNNTLSVTGLTPVPSDTASTGLVAQVSADITAMIPDTSDMATQTWVNEQGFLTAHQDISNKLDTTAFSTVSGDFLTAIPSEYVTENTLQSGLSSKLDSTAFSTVSGNFLTAHQSLDGLMSADLLEISDNKITGYNGTAFAGQGGGVTGDYELSAGSGISIVDYPLEQKTVISVTAQGGNPEVEQAVIDNSATWNSVSNKLDTTAFSDVSGTFITAHQDLSDYQTTAGMTAYLTGVPNTYLQNTDLSTTDGKVTAISGIPLSAGGSDVPEGVMVESGLEYNAVNEISGYNGSAIAQYGAEKQWLVHDDTLVHAANSAQYALGVNLSAVAQLLGIDETVLWSGQASAVNLPILLNESFNNFNKIKFKLSMDDCDNEIVYDITDSRTYYGLSLNNISNSVVYMNWLKLSANDSHNTFVISQTKNVEWNRATTATSPSQSRVDWEWTCRALRQIVGIGRKN